MTPSKTTFALVLAGAIALALPSPGIAQGQFDYTIGLLAGIGGSTESAPDTGFDNTGPQVLFSMHTARHTNFQVRLGQMTLDVDNDPLDLFETDLAYLTVGGQYTFPGGFYESGLFAALGVYDLSSDGLLETETAFGLSVGVTGDFRLSEHWSIWAELSGHYADLDVYQFFGMGHVGLAYHF